MTGEDFWKLEERFWLAGAESARSLTAADAIMVLPYPDGILQGDSISAGLEGQSNWRTVVFSDRVLTRNHGVVVLAYKVSAETADKPIYHALCASTYLQDDDSWLLMAHQQLPIV
ncbi:MAG: hypothetical protein ACU0CA_15780 [Paracoccaceae bacterium]